ncbi:MAG: ComEC/Rec2 family competence protein [Anaerolineales bacterium]|nr:ComEC/Rec2 family competence protein [Anaerolineales bacterium]
MSLSHEAQGTVLLYANREADWRYGDQVRAYGYLLTPPEFKTFSYRDYLARQGIHSIMANASIEVIESSSGNHLLALLFSIRNTAQQIIMEIFPDPEASLLSGILLGREHGISPSVQDAFNITGTTHIIAISGFNITIIAGFVIAMFGKWLGRRRGMVAAGVVILLYTILVGADAAVVRSAIMGGITLMARLVGRQTYAFASLSASAIVLSLINPYILVDVGFQLSFAATMGLILYADPLKESFIRVASKQMGEERARAAANPVSEYVLMTFAAQITTLPLTMLYFQRFSIISFLVNPLILPVQPAIMMGGGAAVLMGMLWLPAGRLTGIPIWLFLAYTIRIVETGASMPLASLPAPVDAAAWCLGYYTLLLSLTVYFSIVEDRRPLWDAVQRVFQRARVSAGSAVLALALAAGLVWRAAAAAPDGLLHLTFFPAGNGDMLLIETPDGRRLLIDGGESPVQLAEMLGRRLPPWNRTIDILLLAGTRDNQLAGLIDITDRISISEVFYPAEVGGHVAQALLEEFHSEEVFAAPLEAGMQFTHDTLEIEVLTESPQGVALLLTYDRFRMLMLQGADPDTALSLAGNRELENLTALLLADAGSDAPNPNALLETIRPRFAILSIEEGRVRGRPSRAILDALEETSLLRTDELGWIEIVSNGQQMWLNCAHAAPAP